jgi:hypothetical protein
LKTIIAGSRDIVDYSIIEQTMKMVNWEITEVVSGGAKGVDLLGEVWAKTHGIFLRVFPAQWDLFGKEAGFKRNSEMVDYADCLIAIRKDKSRGTTDTIHKALRKPMKFTLVRDI